MSNIGLLPQRYELYLEYAIKIRNKFFTLLQCCNKAINTANTDAGTAKPAPY